MLESFFLLPSHMIHVTKLEKYFEKKGWGKKLERFREHFIHVVEDRYADVLHSFLNKRGLILLFFSLLLGGSFYIYKNKMRYVMFPREETRDFSIRVVGNPAMKRIETAQKVRPIEDIFLNDQRGIVTAVYTRIGMNRRGGAVKENEASVRVEIVPATERKESINQLLKDWEERAKKIEGFDEIRFMKSRFGSDSGSSLAIQIQENNDERRSKVVEELVATLEKDGRIIDIEIERPVQKNEYRLSINKAEASRLNVSYSQLASTLRSYIEGNILYTLNKGEEEIDVRLTSHSNNKDNLEKILDLTVGNNDGYLVPIRKLVNVHVGNKDANIQRVNFRRTTIVYGSIKRDLKVTPLEMAEDIEKTIFPQLQQRKATTSLSFVGEVKDSRESQSDFGISVLMVLGLIYILLIFLYDSLWTPLLIGAIIPFGIVGSVLAFYFHGMQQYGFFSVVGTLGMIGVVINDSIVLIDKLNEKIVNKENLFYQIAKVSSTRLRAIFITTFTTVAGLLPTAYGVGGYDSMLAEMMLAMCWGLLFGMFITLVLVPCIYSLYAQVKLKGMKS
jgi:multidrug efflux pump subunit AcrB